MWKLLWQAQSVSTSLMTICTFSCQVYYSEVAPYKKTMHSAILHELYKNDYINMKMNTSPVLPEPPNLLVLNPIGCVEPTSILCKTSTK